MDKKACPHEFLMNSSCGPHAFLKLLTTTMLYAVILRVYTMIYMCLTDIKKDSDKTLNTVLQESSVIRILFVSTGFLSDIR